jgi:hypothetical protein
MRPNWKTPTSARATPPTARARGRPWGDLRGAEKRSDGLGRAQRASMSSLPRLFECSERERTQRVVRHPAQHEHRKGVGAADRLSMSPGACPAPGPAGRNILFGHFYPHLTTSCSPINSGRIKMR